MATIKRRVNAVLHIKKLRKLGDFIDRAVVIVSLIEKSPSVYAGLLAKAAQVKLNIVELKKAQAKVLTGLKGTAAVRNAKYTKVLEGIWGLMRGVQDMADKEPNELKAAALIQGAGFKVKQNRVWRKPDLEVRATRAPRTVKLIAKAGGKDDFYNWQQSINKGLTWVDLPDTHTATIIVIGLPVLKEIWFRNRSVSRKKGVTDWSKRVSIILDIEINS